MVRLRLGYPDEVTERAILRSRGKRSDSTALKPLLDPETVLAAFEAVDSVRVEDAVQDYLLSLVEATRNTSSIALGVSTRGALPARERLRRGRIFLGGTMYCPTISNTLRFRFSLIEFSSAKVLDVEARARTRKPRSATSWHPYRYRFEERVITRVIIHTVRASTILTCGTGDQSSWTVKGDTPNTMSDQRDYYSLLNVPRDVSPEDLKKAFRKKALAYHPDRNQSPGAEEEFKAINTAYAVLSDPDRRAHYDRFGHDSPTGVGDPFSGGVRPDDLRDIFGGDVFDQLFGQFFRRRPGASHGRDQRVSLEIDLETIAQGGDYELTYQRRCPCEPCGTSGAAPGTQAVPCGACGGIGQIRRGQGFISIMQNCPQCGGQGMVIPSPCPSCGGDGVGLQKVTIEMTVPAGVNDGHTLRLDGEGHHGLRGGQPETFTLHSASVNTPSSIEMETISYAKSLYLSVRPHWVQSSMSTP